MNSGEKAGKGLASAEKTRKVMSLLAVNTTSFDGNCAFCDAFPDLTFSLLTNYRTARLRAPSKATRNESPLASAEKTRKVMSLLAVNTTSFDGNCATK
jgi:nucleoid-associated protein YgaU